MATSRIEDFVPEKEKPGWNMKSARSTSWWLTVLRMRKKKKAILITSIGATTYTLLRSITVGVSDKSYEDVRQVLRAHFSPAPSEIVQRFRFNSCVRKPGESVVSFLPRLRATSEHCNYGDSLEPMLRDRLVCGIGDKTIQKRLLSEPKLTHKRAVELARELETADQDLKILQTQKRDSSDSLPGSTSSGRVHRLNRTMSNPPNPKVVRSCFSMWTARSRSYPLYVSPGYRMSLLWESRSYEEGLS